MSSEKEIVNSWSDKEFLEKVIKETSLIEVPGGGTSDQRYFALKRINGAAKIRLENLT